MSGLPNGSVVGVIGAGTMGAGIAQVAAQAGHPVRLHDIAEGAARAALDGVAKRLRGRVERGKMSAEDCEAVIERMQAVDDLDGFAGAALVVEAVAERLDIKQQLFGRLETVCGETAILATNTSSLSVTAIGAPLAHPQRLVGMHFFNPAPVMPLVEVVSGLATSEAVRETVVATAAAWGKRPVRTRSTPGFIVNRVARPFYGETLRLIEEQAGDAATLDTLMKEAGGFRMGPCELMDLIGHDVNSAVSRSVFDLQFGDPRYRPSLVQRELVAAGRLGRKSGRGFYDYADDAAAPAVATLEPGAAPSRITVEGDLGPAAPLAERLEQAGVAVDRTDGAGHIRVDGVQLAMSDGRTATERAAADRVRDLVVFDLALDYATTPRLAVAAADQATPEALATVAGLLNAAGIATTALDDAPGLLVLRTVAMLANEGAEAVLQGVCDAPAVDDAMRYGTNYPRGPLAWADDLGAAFVLGVLANIFDATGDDRYRPSLRLRRTAAAGGRFTAED